MTGRHCPRGGGPGWNNSERSPPVESTQRVLEADPSREEVYVLTKPAVDACSSGVFQG